MNIITVYYRRVQTFCKYPFNDEIDTDLVLISTSKKSLKKFEENVILRLNPLLSIKERHNAVAEKLGLSVNKVNVVKF
jgi:hypothetical protein